MKLEQPYKRQTVGPDSSRFKRWLVTVDVVPDVGEVAGYQTVNAQGRTLNVEPKASLLAAVDLIHRTGRALKHLAHTARWNPTGFRYAFCLLDLTTQTAVTPEQLLAWSELHSIVPPVGSEPGTFYREVEQAASVARSLSGYFAPQATLLDGRDPFTILRNQGLLPLRPSGSSPSNVQPDALRKSVSDAIYSEAIRTANDAGNLDWVSGLAALPVLLGAALDRSVASKVAELTSEALGQSFSLKSPRVSSIAATVERTVTPLRAALVLALYKQILTSGYAYQAPGALDDLAATALEGAWKALPNYLNDFSNPPGPSVPSVEIVNPIAAH